MKQINNFSATNGTFKRPELFSNPTRLTPPSSFLNIPNDNQGERLSPSSTTPTTPLTPNFEFKKKKFYENSSELTMPKNVGSSREIPIPKGEFLTMK